jgi:hypothetical protein
MKSVIIAIVLIVPAAKPPVPEGRNVYSQRTL